MKAAVLREAGRPLTIEEVGLAEPRAGEVQVRVLAAGVCHSDLHYMTGDLPALLPIVLGHEGAGIVDSVGAGVTRFTPGDTVVMTWRPRCGHCRYCAVVGAGGVGLSAVMGARLVGAHPIIVADVSRDRLNRALTLGATHNIQVDDEPMDEAVRRIWPDGVEWAFDAVGKADTVQAAMASLRPGGTTVAIGLGPAGATVAVPINDLVQKEKRLIGRFYGSANTVLQIPQLRELHAAGQLDLDALVGATYPLDRITDAFDRLVRGAVGRGVIVPQSTS